MMSAFYDKLEIEWIVTSCFSMVAVPTILVLCLWFWKLRNHFVISQRFYRFSIAIVVLSGIGYTLSFLVFTLKCFGVIKTEMQFTRSTFLPHGVSHVVISTVFYRMLLVYLRGKVGAICV